MNECLWRHSWTLAASVWLQALICGTAESGDTTFPSSLWVVWSRLKKTSVAKHSSIPQSPETIIITLWPVNKGSSSKLLGEMVSGLGGWCLGCGADIHSHPHLRWIIEQQKDGLRLGASHSFGSHCARRVNKAYLTTIRLIQTGRNAHLNWGVSRPQTE